MKRLIFVSLTVALWTACLAVAAVVALEHFGGYQLIERWTKNKKFEIYHTNYYGAPRDSDPYDTFSVQQPHPFYLFGFPWVKARIAQINTKIISLNDYGFRNSHQNGASARAVLLGGSTAFGSQATSDTTTIASGLNKLQMQYDFFNFGVPSWNSHQEMVAYTKVPFDTRYVIAFSGSNDFVIAYRYCQKGYDFLPGTPESFEHLAATSGMLPDKARRGFLGDLFPQTHEKISNLLKPERERRTINPDCQKRIAEAADAFIANQRVIRDLARERGAKYLLALQPHIDFIRKPVRQPQAGAAELRAMFFQRVLDSELCRTSRCMNFSGFFANANPLHVEDARDAPEQAIFVDRVHLTDRGYATVSEILAVEIAK